MEKLKRKWRRLPLPEKIALVASLVSGLALLALSILVVTKNYSSPTALFLFPGALLMLALCMLNWRKNRKGALACLYTGLLTAAAYALTFLI